MTISEPHLNQTNGINEPYVKYKRKSQEDKSKQVASISSQERTFKESISLLKHLNPSLILKKNNPQKAQEDKNLTKCVYY